jgi:hypothetical protein
LALLTPSKTRRFNRTGWHVCFGKIIQTQRPDSVREHARKPFHLIEKPVVLTRPLSPDVRVHGLADLIDTLPKLPRSELRASFAKHRVPESEIDEDFKWSTAWVLQRARSLQDPIPYRHPAGAVIWVNLDPKVAAVIEQQLAGG